MSNQNDLQKQRNEFMQSTQDLSLMVLDLQKQKADLLEALKAAEKTIAALEAKYKIERNMAMNHIRAAIAKAECA